MAVYALTGATGFIGRALSQHLLGSGHDVRALARAAHRITDSRVKVIEGSLEDRDSLRKLVDQSDAVIHLAGSVAGLHRRDFFKTNAAGTTHLVETMEQSSSHVPLIAVSSLAARHPELSDYAASKRAGEEIIKASSLSWALIRPPAVHGPEDVALRPLWQLMRHGLLPEFSEPSARFSMIHVSDLAEAIATVCTQWSVCERQVLELDDQYHFESQKGYGWMELETIGQAVFGRKIHRLPIPKSVLLSAAGLADVIAWLRRTPNVFTVGKVHELRYPTWVANHANTWQEIGWSPRRQLHDTLSTLT